MKKLLAIVLSLVFVLSLAGCGSSSNNDKKIVVGASATPHAEILEQVKSVLSEKGYTLEIKVYDDYILPNTAVEDGSLDANYFQHKPYLDNFNESNSTHLASVAAIHYEPYGIYAGTAKTLADLKAGDKIAVPNDATNEARALLLLEANGLITLKEGAGLTATKNDIVANPQNFDIVEMEAAVIPSCLDSVGVAVINGNYALKSNLSIKDALGVEDKNSEAAQTYANILCVKVGNENSEKTLALIDALKSETVKNYIDATYGGAVVTIF